MDVLGLARGTPLPSLTPRNNVLLRVKATAVNRGDTAQRRGIYPPPPGVTDVLGLEACGIVEEVYGGGAESCGGVKVGDRVMALLPGGGYADYVTVPASHLLPLPPHMSFHDGAAVAEVFLTAWQCLAVTMNVRAGDHVLLHAAASGVGTAAGQLCERVLGATAVGTCSERKVDECLKFMKYAVSRTPEMVRVPARGSGGKRGAPTPPSASQGGGPAEPAAFVEVPSVFESKVRRVLGDKPLINAVIDPVFGGSYLTESINLCANDAQITVLAMMGGATLKEFNASAAFRKRIGIHFSTLRSRDDAYKAALVKSFAERALPFFAEEVPQGQRLRPVVQAVLPIEEVAEAHRLVDANDTVGKIVLSLD